MEQLVCVIMDMFAAGAESVSNSIGNKNTCFANIAGRPAKVESKPFSFTSLAMAEIKFSFLYESILFI